MLYHDSGYLNMDFVININVPFIFVIGGRGTGKTYGALKYVLDHGLKFLLLRRTQTQVDMIRDDQFNPFRKYKEYNIGVKNINKNMTGVYQTAFDEEKQMNVISGAPIGYICALSTISNIRGFNADDIDIIIFDEFIGEKHERSIKEEGNAVLNAYETINRNRELEGRQPVKFIALANSNNLANPLFMQLKLVSVVERMKAKEQEIYVNNKTGLAIILLQKTKISEAKEKTALYQLAGDSEFSQMSLSNEFSAEERSLIASRNLNDFKPVCFVGELAIYRKDREYYVTDHKRGSAKTYEASEMDLHRFRRECYFIWIAYLHNKIIFESYFMQKLFESYFNIH